MITTTDGGGGDDDDEKDDGDSDDDDDDEAGRTSPPRPDSRSRTMTASRGMRVTESVNALVRSSSVFLSCHTASVM